MSISKKNCPIPFDQQPLNEYFLLKDSQFFAWSLSDTNKYLLTIFYLFIILFILGYPIICLFISIKKFFFKSIILDTLFVHLILLFIFIRLYLGWSYIIKRLLSATVFYEESGWYDGQIWIKSAESLMQDRLIGLYELMPFLKRLKSCIMSFVCLLIFESILFYLL
uniref:Ycf36 n=1 Tax=Centroceras clavulatum TaxID=159503 RepID=A0A4D6WRQ8_9FLOR|nr:hypothetical protein [Centroceras clavulatum]